MTDFPALQFLNDDERWEFAGMIVCMRPYAGSSQIGTYEAFKEKMNKKYEIEIELWQYIAADPR